MSTAEKFTPIVWWLESSDDDIRVELVRAYTGTRYAVRAHGCALGRSGAKLKWDYEPRPSSRTDRWLETHRWDTLEAAMDAALRAPKR
jgi:hypothetical protein